MDDECDLCSLYSASQLTILKIWVKLKVTVVGFRLEWKNPRVVNFIKLTSTLQVVKWQNPSIGKNHGEFVDDFLVRHLLGMYGSKVLRFGRRNYGLSEICHSRNAGNCKRSRVVTVLDGCDASR